MSILTKAELLSKLLDAFAAGSWTATPLVSDKPFLIRAVAPDGRSADFRIFIWNCTHGGGAARPKNEYRIQFTGKMPSALPNATTLLLGWHEGYEVFAAWDINFHDNQVSKSPSAQIREEALENAHRQSFAKVTRDNGEIALAFRAEYLADYALASKALHQNGKAIADFDILNIVPNIVDTQLDKIENTERREIIATIVRRYRASDFRQRVLSAYGFRCAVCGIQLELIDAAHIEPVSQHGSSDETCNGIALCKLHHAAFDSLLISFDERFRVQISQSRIAALTAIGRGAGSAAFQRALKPAIVLPADQRDYPNPAYIKRSRKSRGWVG
jgi:putative restriction endonuclease